ncbi:MAG: TRAM domain-containing protein, partial [Mycobacterium sp.]|nr:TRAM domain-containing protein [Mycobacterium sp.]
MTEVTVTVGAPANGGSCVARHDGRVIFVRHALPGEVVRARVTSERGAYWHADVVEVIDASPDRVDSLCPIAGVDGSGCCDLAFVDPTAARRLKGEVVANQLARLGGYELGETDLAAAEVGTTGPTGWRTRVRLDVGADGRAGFHRYHSDELVTD